MNIAPIKPNSGLAKGLERVYAWFAGELLDRPPIRFSRHNAEYELRDNGAKTWPSLKDRWFDAEYQLGQFLSRLQSKAFLGETFPVFWPNLGPNVFAAGYGCPLEFGEVTSWAEPVLNGGELSELSPDVSALAYNWNNEYFKKLDQMTDMALERAQDRFLVGYTDLHPALTGAPRCGEPSRC